MKIGHFSSVSVAAAAGMGGLAVKQPLLILLGGYPSSCLIRGDHQLYSAEIAKSLCFCVCVVCPCGYPDTHPVKRGSVSVPKLLSFFSASDKTHEREQFSSRPRGWEPEGQGCSVLVCNTVQ